MKIMAIDYGDAHTGIAISDYTETLAGYSDTIHSRRQEEVLSGIQRLIAEHGVQLLVLGYPRNMDGTEGPRAEKCAAFVKASLEGWRYARAHPEETLDVVMRYVEQDNLPTNRPHMRWMLGEILDYAAAKGLSEVWGDVARENTAMLRTAKSFGFERRAAEDFTRVKIVKTLAKDAG